VFEVSAGQPIFVVLTWKQLPPGTTASVTLEMSST
jgi:hypothetical protein